MNMENNTRKYFASENTPYWLLTISVMILLVLPVLIQDGMFLDGVLYTCVSNNLSHGYGSFWSPMFSPAGFGGSPYFLEQPPLVFGIQSLFFRLFGDSMYVDNCFSHKSFVETNFQERGSSQKNRLVTCFFLDYDTHLNLVVFKQYDGKQYGYF
jgi:hypothetical protein